MNHEKFKNLTAGIQSVVIAVAVVIGGCWTLYTFRSLNQAEAAKRQLEELEQRLRTHAVVQITIRPEQIESWHRKTPLILAHVDFRNTGSRATDLLYDPEGPLTATLVLPQADGTLSFGETLRVKQYFNYGTVNGGTVMHLGDTHTVDFVIPVSSKGLYLLAFAVDVQPAEVEMALQAGMPVTHKAHWATETYFNVK